jgi:hypothetical protein
MRLQVSRCSATFARRSGEAGSLAFTSRGETRRVTPLTRVFSVIGLADFSVVTLMASQIRSMQRAQNATCK